MFRLHKDCRKDETTDAAHGRVETRICEATGDLTFMDDKIEWPGIRSIVRVKSQRFIKQTGAESNEIKYYITSVEANPVKLNKAIRSHWSIENNLHWNQDVVFNEDNSMKKKDKSAVKFNIVLKIALTLLEKESSVKASKKRKRFFAALDDNYSEKILKC